MTADWTRVGVFARKCRGCGWFEILGQTGLCAICTVVPESRQGSGFVQLGLSMAVSEPQPDAPCVCEGSGDGR